MTDGGVTDGGVTGNGVPIGIGLPGTDTDVLLNWAQVADRGPFGTLALFDRLPYENAETLVALAAVAAVTERIRLQSEVVVAPIRQTPLLAKQAATLDRLARGRFSLGLGGGVRADDFAVAGADLRTRGARLERQLVELRELWAADSPVGPAPRTPGGPPILIGAFAEPAIDRAARLADGFIGANQPPARMSTMFDLLRRRWREHGRSGEPRLVAQLNVALGSDDVRADAADRIRRYYTVPGFDPNTAVAGLLTSADMVRAARRDYAAIGADELIAYCWSPDINQVARLADCAV